MRIWGFEIKRTDDNFDSFVPKDNSEGAIVVGAPYGQVSSTAIDLFSGVTDETSLITRYRSMALDSEVTITIQDIVNEAINVGTEDDIVKIITDDVPVDDKIKKMIGEEFDNILTLLDFSNQAYDIFRDFYVDGRLNYHVIIDKEKPQLGIQKVRKLDPRKIRLIREDVVLDRNVSRDRMPTVKTVNEYYVYNDQAFIARDTVFANHSISMSGLKIAKDSIVRVTSGILNETGTLILGWLHPAIKPFNQMKMLEDAVVIYRISRAPERRIFYIDTGNMPKSRSDQYLKDLMTRHKNTLSYNTITGETSSDKAVMTMTHDYWFARKEGSRGTQVDMQQGGQNLGDMEDVLYFQKKLFRALSVPLGRIESDNVFNMGRPSEITREEIRFSKFIDRIRNRFSILFDEMLERQLVLKNIIRTDEWSSIKDAIRYDFVRDNFYQELKETEILKTRFDNLRDVHEIAAGTYVPERWIAKNILKQTDDEIAEYRKEMEEERIKNRARDSADDDNI